MSGLNQIEPPLSEMMSSSDEAPEYDELLDEAERLLEFDRVRGLLADEARCFISREIISNLHPSRNAEDVKRLQAETFEACLLLTRQGDIGLAGMFDAREPLRRAMLDGILGGQELLGLCAVFDSIWVARSVALKAAEYAPHLARMAGDILDLRELRSNISDSLSDSGDVLDSATPRLGRLRAGARRAYQRAMRIMDGLANDDLLKPYLQSNVVASRSERLVLEVKSSHRQFVPGIIHDVSGTGQTIFVEPFSVVDAANEWRESSSEARREEERVLRKLTRAVALRAEDALASLQAAANLDAVVARGRLALKMSATRPNLDGSEVSPPESQQILLLEARHPLLAEDVVPITLQIDADRRGMVITGPNTGGKTVALKTVGLFALMHQTGMHVPAREGSRLPVFDGVFADIGDSQSIDRSVSTFSSHMGRVIEILSRTTDRSLVLLDELGTGTDPEEGSALACAVLEHLVGRGIWTCITTHHRQVSEFAAINDSLSNASVELDADTLMPSYRLIMGVPGQSYAMHVAKRLGMPEDVLEVATRLLDPRRSEAEGLLKRLQTDREILREEQEKALTSTLQAREKLRTADEELDRAETESMRMVDETREQLRQEAQRVRRQLRRLMREAKGKQAWEQGRRSAAEIVHEIRDANWMGRREGGRISDENRSDNREDRAGDSFGVGDEVEVSSLGLTGKIVEFDGEGEATVMAGSMRIQARPNMMTLVAKATAIEIDERSDGVAADPTVAPLYEADGDLDVRGSRVHMIESMVPQFIDRAFMQGLTSVRIIHGEGTGALREAVRDVLSREPHVEAFQRAPANEGGNSVTVALLE